MAYFGAKKSDMAARPFLHQGGHIEIEFRNDQGDFQLALLSCATDREIRPRSRLRYYLAHLDAALLEVAFERGNRMIAIMDDRGNDRGVGANRP